MINYKLFLIINIVKKAQQISMNILSASQRGYEGQRQEHGENIQGVPLEKLFFSTVLVSLVFIVLASLEARKQISCPSQIGHGSRMENQPTCTPKPQQAKNTGPNPFPNRLSLSSENISKLARKHIFAPDFLNLHLGVFVSTKVELKQWK